MQIVSDLHLEFYKTHELLDKVKIKPNAQYLGLLGDICVCGTNDIINIEKFLDYYSTKYKIIFWLAGNHEFYSGKKSYKSIDDILIRCKTLCKKYNNVIFLNNKHYDLNIDDTLYRIIGTTLWTHIPEEKENYVIDNMNDYNHIYVTGQRNVGPFITIEGVVRLSPKDVNLMHAKSVKYINRHLRDSPYPVIILTHHKPFLSDSTFINIGYETDVIGLFNDKYKSKIKLWAYGHTHKHFDSIVNGVHFFSNPKGYPGQQTKFENGLIVKFENKISIKPQNAI